MRLDKRFKSPKILRGRLVIVPEKAPDAHSDRVIPPGRYIVLSIHLFGITVSPENAVPTAIGENTIYGVRWEFTDRWELAE